MPRLRGGGANSELPAGGRDTCLVRRSTRCGAAGSAANEKKARADIDRPKVARLHLHRRRQPSPLSMTCKESTRPAMQVSAFAAVQITNMVQVEEGSQASAAGDVRQPGVIPAIESLPRAAGLDRPAVGVPFPKTASSESAGIGAKRRLLRLRRRTAGQTDRAHQWTKQPDSTAGSHNVLGGRSPSLGLISKIPGRSALSRTSMQQVPSVKPMPFRMRSKSGRWGEPFCQSSVL